MEQHKSPSRRLRIFLRDFRMVEAVVNLAEGQSLASFFALRKGYVNLREAHWPGTNERVEHAALKVEQVLWVAAVGDVVPLTMGSAPTAGRSIEIQLDGGLLLRARLSIGKQQRLNDYLEAAGRFLPLTDAQLLRSGRPSKRVNVQLGDIVLNQEAIQAAWETAAQTGDVVAAEIVAAVDAAAEPVQGEATETPQDVGEEEPLWRDDAPRW